PDGYAFDYLQNGNGWGWSNLDNPALVEGTPVNNAAAPYFYGGSNGVVIAGATDGQPSPKPVLLSTIVPYDPNWHYCNGSADSSTKVQMMYREKPVAQLTLTLPSISAPHAMTSLIVTALDGTGSVDKTYRGT